MHKFSINFSANFNKLYTNERENSKVYRTMYYVVLTKRLSRTPCYRQVRPEITKQTP